MKYIKGYKLFELNSNKIDILQDIDDILIPLKDEDITYKVNYAPEENINLIHVEIGFGMDPNGIDLSDKLVESTIHHLINYMKSNDYEMSVEKCNLIFCRETDRIKNIIKYLHDLIKRLRMYINGETYIYGDNNGSLIFNYHRYNNSINYNYEYFNYVIKNELKISVTTLEIFLRYMLMTELSLNVLKIEQI